MDSIRLINLLNDVESLQTRRKKTYKERKDPFQLSDCEFKYRYRFMKTTVKTIIELIKDDLKLNVNGSGTPVSLEILTALRCCGRGEVQDDAADLHGLSQASKIISSWGDYMAIVRCFGVLKQRYRCLLNGLTVNLTKSL